MATIEHETLASIWPKLRFPKGVCLSDRFFSQLCVSNPDLRLERTAKGELVIMTPAGSESGRRNGRLCGRLYNWAVSNNVGELFDSSAGFTLSSGAILSPDASWIENERWNALTPDERKGFAHICPDFVAELRSETDPLRELRRKMREYRAAGARLGWLIDPKRGVVEIYRPGRPVEVLANPSTLSGEAVLPGFVLDLKGILTD
jgi:Uma2 family endonuclease